MIFLRLLCYFYYLCVLTILVREFLDQQEDPEPDSTEKRLLVLVNDVFISLVGRGRTNLSQ